MRIIYFRRPNNSHDFRVVGAWARSALFGQPRDTIGPRRVLQTRNTRAVQAPANRPTTNEGTCPPPDVTFANPVELNRVKNPHIFPRKR